MQMKLYNVDSFTSEIFKGNPAGVCVLNEDITDDMKQNIDSEMNCSEASFVQKIDKAYRIRYFTPSQEVRVQVGNTRNQILGKAKTVFEIKIVG